MDNYLSCRLSLSSRVRNLEDEQQSYLIFCHNSTAIANPPVKRGDYEKSTFLGGGLFLVVDEIMMISLLSPF